MNTEDTIPCISLWQPWATLMAIGAKPEETRSWETLYRGPIAIQAALTWNKTLARRSCTGRFGAALNAAGVTVTTWKAGDSLPKGKIVCVVDLLDCVRITTENAPSADSDSFAFGDYTPGRFSWRTANPRRAIIPIPYRGRQRIFSVPVSLLREGGIAL